MQIFENCLKKKVSPPRFLKVRSLKTKMRLVVQTSEKVLFTAKLFFNCFSFSTLFQTVSQLIQTMINWTKRRKSDLHG